MAEETDARPVELDVELTRGRDDQSREETEQGRLARTVGAGHEQELAGADVEVEPREDALFPEPPTEAGAWITVSARLRPDPGTPNLLPTAIVIANFSAHTGSCRMCADQRSGWCGARRSRLPMTAAFAGQQAEGVRQRLSEHCESVATPPGEPGRLTTSALPDPRDPA